LGTLWKASYRCRGGVLVCPLFTINPFQRFLHLQAMRAHSRHSRWPDDIAESSVDRDKNFEFEQAVNWVRYAAD